MDAPEEGRGGGQQISRGDVGLIAACRVRSLKAEERERYEIEVTTSSEQIIEAEKETTGRGFASSAPARARVD